MFDLRSIFCPELFRMSSLLYANNSMVISIRGPLRSENHLSHRHPSKLAVRHPVRRQIEAVGECWCHSPGQKVEGTLWEVLRWRSDFDEAE